MAGGRIVDVSSQRPDASEVVDASGMFVMPGGVDTHVHLMDPGDAEREDFPTGTSAAAASGVTTIIEHSHGRPVRSVADLIDKVDYLSDRSNVDYGLAAHAWPGEAEVVGALWAAGVAFFKVFTCTTHGVPGHDAAALKAHLEASALAGAVSLMHCEDESLTEVAESMLQAAGRDDPGVLPEWRNRDAELVAAAVAALLVRRTGARATIAHVSNDEVASYIAAERARGATIGAEGCPQYFLLREDEVHEHGALRKFTPPARARTDDDEAQLWRLLRRACSPTCRAITRRRRSRRRPQATSGRSISGCPGWTARCRCCSTPRRADTCPTRTSPGSTAQIAGPYLRSVAEKGAARAGRRRRPRPGRPGGDPDPAQRRRAVQGGLDAVRRADRDRPGRADLSTRSSRRRGGQADR